jgi:hypothetical protein
MPLPGRLAVAVAVGAGLAAAILLSRTGGSAHYGTLALVSGAAVALLVAGLAVLDRRRVAPAP